MAEGTQKKRIGRRGLLIGAGAAMGLGLAGYTALPHLRERPRPVVSLELEPIEVDAALRADGPVIVGTHPLSALGERPAALLVESVEEKGRILQAVSTVESKPQAVPVDPGAIAVHVDDRQGKAVILTEIAGASGIEHRLLVSSDLSQWDSRELSAPLPGLVTAFGDGIAVMRTRMDAVQIVEIGDDGACTPLRDLPTPAREAWSIRAVQRMNERLHVLASAALGGPDPVPLLVVSDDAGTSWKAPVQLTTPGQQARAHALIQAGEQLVVIGREQMTYDWNDAGDAGQWRPVAWRVEGGGPPVREEIPLPPWGEDHFVEDDRGELEEDTPMDFASVQGGHATVTADGAVQMPVHFGDSLHRVRREGSGWKLTEDRVRFWSLIHGGLWAQDGPVLHLDDGVFTLWGEEEFYQHLQAGPRPEWEIEEIPATGGALLLDEREESRISRSEERISWETERSVQVGLLAPKGLERSARFPVELHELSQRRMHALEKGVAVTGRKSRQREGAVDWNDTEYAGVALWSSTNGVDWVQASGLPEDGMWNIGEVHEASGELWLPLGVFESDFARARVYRSKDGVTWTEHGAAAERTWIDAVLEIHGEPMGIGQAADAQGRWAGAVFRFRDGAWSTVRVDPALGVDEIDSWERTDGVLILLGDTESGDRVELAVAADGTVTEQGRRAADEWSGESIDLGDGAIVELRTSRDPSWPGTRLWASRDGGEHWDPTAIPELLGRFPYVRALRCGADVVLAADHPRGPRLFRITDAKEKILADA